mmetsp:Transcript_39350/g.103803  ORF Transcript_39350/g.103803 Transcript_39350/m.103803 type:complete len:200 (-) Transcript_39350:702-1301(-)
MSVVGVPAQRLVLLCIHGEAYADPLSFECGTARYAHVCNAMRRVHTVPSCAEAEAPMLCRPPLTYRGPQEDGMPIYAHAEPRRGHTDFYGLPSIATHGDQRGKDRRCCRSRFALRRIKQWRGHRRDEFAAIALWRGCKQFRAPVPISSLDQDTVVARLDDGIVKAARARAEADAQPAGLSMFAQRARERHLTVAEAETV